MRATSLFLRAAGAVTVLAALAGCSSAGADVAASAADPAAPASVSEAHASEAPIAGHEAAPAKAHGSHPDPSRGQWCGEITGVDLAARTVTFRAYSQLPRWG